METGESMSRNPLRSFRATITASRPPIPLHRAYVFGLCPLLDRIDRTGVAWYT